MHEALICNLEYSTSDTLEYVYAVFTSMHLQSIILYCRVRALLHIHSFHQVTLSIHLDAGLSLLNRRPGPLSIQAESSNHFEMRILSRAIGQLPIRITAQVVGTNMKDAVEKPLNVKVHT